MFRRGAAHWINFWNSLPPPPPPNHNNNGIATPVKFYFLKATVKFTVLPDVNLLSFHGIGGPRAGIEMRQTMCEMRQTKIAQMA